MLNHTFFRFWLFIEPCFQLGRPSRSLGLGEVLSQFKDEFILAPALFLLALWAASYVFIRMERGDAFGPTMVKGLKKIGGSLMLGAWAAIVAQPSLTHLVSNGFREMRGVRFNLTVESLTLALVGLVLILLARRGQKLKSTLDQFV